MRSTRMCGFTAVGALATALLALMLALGARVSSASAAEACPNEPVRLTQPHALALPDCRAYEQVSPGEDLPLEKRKGGNSAEGAPAAVQASPSGGAFMYFSTGPFFGNSESDPTYVSSRGGTPLAWSTVNILPKAKEGDWLAFDEDLSEAVEYSEVTTPEGAPLAANERYFYLHESATGVDRHLLTLNVSGDPGSREYWAFTVDGFSADGSRIFFESNLLAAATGKIGLYEYDLETEAISPVGLVPRGSESSCTGSSCVVSSTGSVAGASYALDNTFTKSAVSEDGSVVFFTANGEGELEPGGQTGRIYARIGGEKTIAVSEGTALYRTATPNGEYVFYEEGGVLFRFGTQTAQREAIAGGRGTGDLSATAAGFGNLSSASVDCDVTAGSTKATVTLLREGALVRGQMIEGYGIAPGTTIEAVAGATLTLSQPATVSVANTYHAGSTEVTGLTTTTGAFRPGQALEGEDIAPGTTIEVVTASTLTVSRLPVGAGGEGLPLIVGPSEEVSGFSLAVGVFSPGEPIEGRGIRPGTKVQSLTANTLTLTKPPLQAGPVSLIANPDILGTVGVSAGGSTLYYTATGVLTGTQQGPDGEVAEEQFGGGGFHEVANLYVWHQGKGGPATTLFVANLVDSEVGSGESGDSYDWQASAGSDFRSALPRARVTPDGDTLLFAKGGTNGETESVAFFRYRAAEGGKPASLLCVTCYPAGTMPTVGAGALLGGETEENGHGAHHSFLVTPRNLSEDGDRVFFQTPDPLLGEDTNGRPDVYEWEADGEGSCRSESQDGGCLFLLSTGKSPRESYFGDASANGDDVFFFTAQRLASTDEDEAFDVYDARVNGGACGVEGFPACPPPPPKERTPCTSAEECKPPPGEPPIESFPATAAFNGPGNLVSPIQQKPPPKPKTPAQLRAEKLAKALKACHKKRGKKRTACEKQARRGYAPAKKAKKKVKR